MRVHYMHERDIDLNVLGFTGQTCETDIDECLSNPCANNGSCENVRNGFICDCLDGFSGSRCQVEINYYLFIIINIIFYYYY